VPTLFAIHEDLISCLEYKDVKIVFFIGPCGKSAMDFYSSLEYGLDRKIYPLVVPNF
jgi:hypothetical protein